VRAIFERDPPNFWPDRHAFEACERSSSAYRRSFGPIGVLSKRASDLPARTDDLLT
jgi:hypothetical protein